MDSPKLNTAPVRTPGRSFQIALGTVLCLLTATLLANWPRIPPATAAEAPSFNKSGQLERPRDYREWIYVSSGLGMTYGPSQPAPGRPPLFDNVFVGRKPYREFQRTGRWPDKTVLILEVRRADENVSINNGGRTQGTVAAIEAAVKDQKRFPETGWGYFSFDGPTGPLDAAAPLAASAGCNKCHSTHGAVDNTFVQFYPTLFEVAKRFGTVRPTYDPTRKP